MPSNVSVVIAAYNATPFLRATLDSVFAQTHRPAEIVLVDDASPDGTADLAEDLARDSPIPVRVIRLDSNNGGPAIPLNIGIVAATSDLIATLDHDDRMRPRRLERQVACWESEPTTSLVLCRCETRGGGDLERRIVSYVEQQYREMRGPRLTEDAYLIPARNAREASTKGCFALTCSNMLFPKSTWAMCGGFDPALRLSCDFGFQVAATGLGDFAYVDGVLNDWTVREQSLYHSAAVLNRISERIAILTHLEAEWAPDEAMDSLRSILAQEWMEYAYEARQAARYGEAVRGYLHGIRSRQTRRTAVVGILKLAPHFLLRLPKATRPAT